MEEVTLDITDEALALGSLLDDCMKKVWNDLPPLERAQKDALVDVMWEQLCYSYGIEVYKENADG